jgi:hypothetical protein
MSLLESFGCVVGTRTAAYFFNSTMGTAYLSASSKITLPFLVAICVLPSLRLPPWAVYCLALGAFRVCDSPLARPLVRSSTSTLSWHGRCSLIAGPS